MLKVLVLSLVAGFLISCSKVTSNSRNASTTSGGLAADAVSATQEPLCIDIAGQFQRGAKSTPFGDGSVFLSAGSTQLNFEASTQALLSMCFSGSSEPASLNLGLNVFSGVTAAPKGASCGVAGSPLAEIDLSLENFDCIKLLSSGGGILGSLPLPTGNLKVHLVLK